MKPNRLTNTALNSVADYFDRSEASDSLQAEEIPEVWSKKPKKKQKRLSYSQYPRVKITLKASEKQELEAIAKDRDVPFATFCRDIMMEYLQVSKRC